MLEIPSGFLWQEKKKESDGHRVITTTLQGIVSALKTSLRIMERGVEERTGQESRVASEI